MLEVCSVCLDDVDLNNSCNMDGCLRKPVHLYHKECILITQQYRYAKCIACGFKRPRVNVLEELDARLDTTIASIAQYVNFNIFTGLVYLYTSISRLYLLTAYSIMGTFTLLTIGLTVAMCRSTIDLLQLKPYHIFVAHLTSISYIALIIWLSI